MAADLEVQVGRLQSVDVMERYEAARKLTRMDVRPVVEELVAALVDEGFVTEEVGEDWSGPWSERRVVGDVVAEALGRLRGEAPPPVVKALRHDIAVVRLRVIRALQEMGRSGDVADALAERLLDCDYRVVNAAAEALSQLRGSTAPANLLAKRPEALRTIGQQLHDPEERCQFAACRALSLFPGEPNAAEPLADVLVRQPNHTVAGPAAVSLLAVGPCLSPASVERLLSLFDDPRMRHPQPEMLEALGRYPATERCAYRLLRWAREGENRVPRDALIRTSAARTLGRLQAAEALLPEILAMLHGDDPLQFETALVILGEMRSHAAVVVPEIARELTGARCKATAGALASFGELAAPALARLLELLEPSGHWEIVAAAGEAVAAMGAAGRAAVPRMAALLATPHRNLTMYSLAKMAPYGAAARPALEAVAQDELAPAGIRTLAFRTLAALGATELA